MSKIKELEALRGIAAWWVVAGHLGSVINHGLPAWLDPGLAVDIFIILSGFVIFLTLDKKRDGWAPFITRRAFRIFPVYLLVLAIAAATLGQQSAAILNSPLGDLPQNLGRVEIIRQAKDHYWPNLVSHALLLQGVIPGRFIPLGEFAFIGQAWSVSLEWQFYLVAPLLFWAATTRRWWVLGCAVLALALLRGRVGASFLPNQAHFFAVGAASYYLLKTEALHRYAGTIIAATLAVGAVLLNLPLVIWAVVFGAVLCREVPGASALRRVLTTPALVYLGTISYSTYLVHMLVIFAWMAALNHAPLGLTGYTAALAALSIATTLAGSILLYDYCERPANKIGGQFGSFMTAGGVSDRYYDAAPHRKS